MERVRAEPAVAAFPAEAGRGRRLPLPLLLLLFLRALLVRAVRGVRGRDRGIERGGGHGCGQRGLELVRVQSSTGTPAGNPSGSITISHTPLYGGPPT